MASHACPSCNVPLTQNEARGERCPVCDMPLRGAITRAPAPEWDSEERFTAPEADQAPDDYGLRVTVAPAWHSVAGGLNLIVIATILAIVAAGFLVLVTGLAAGQPGGEGMLVAACFPLLILLAAGIMALIGYIRCCMAPPESGARGLAVGALVCTALAVVLNCLGSAAGQGVRGADGMGNGGNPLSACSGLVNLVSGLLFLLFLRAVAKYFRNEPLARNIITYLVAVGVTFVVGVILAVISFVTLAGQGRGGPDPFAAGPGFALVIGIFVVAIIFIVWQLVLIKRTRDTIRDALSDRGFREADEY